jgi:tRNA (guanine37-N1)-methyltransferase
MTRARKKARLEVDILTLFPKMLEAPLSESMMGRAQEAGVVKFRIHNLRDWSDDPRHQKVDDRPFGGGAGMVIRPEPVYRALKKLGGLKKGRQKAWVVYLSPQGDVLNQRVAEKLATRKKLILLCGHYEGIDERIMNFVDQEVSIGDYVLTGGELPALVLAEAVARLVPGVVGDPESVKNDSFTAGILDYPHYTRPRLWRGVSVPEVLLSGNHQRITQWRRDQALRNTAEKRPDLKRTDMRG